MTRWPWITLVLFVLFGVSPFGQDLVRSAFFSGEQLARTISQFLLYCILGIAAALLAIETAIRMLVARRRARRAGSDA